MKYFPLLFLLILPFLSKGQYINCRVADTETKQPLYYATIYYGSKSAVTFSDSFGKFFVKPGGLKEKDSVIIEFIGYQTLIVSNKEIVENKTFFLHKTSNILQDLVIKNCNQYEEIKINYKYGKMDSYWTVSPNTRISYLSYYANKEPDEGYITEIKFFTPATFFHKQNFSTPLRIRWYDWDSVKQLPGKELTDTSIIVYAHKNGVNKISIPDKTIFFEQKGIVIGIEFLYPPELEKEYFQFITAKEKSDWTLKHEWSIGAINTSNDCEGFIKTEVNSVRKLISAKGGFLKLAFDFKINVCKN